MVKRTSDFRLVVLKEQTDVKQPVRCPHNWFWLLLLWFCLGWSSLGWLRSWRRRWAQRSPSPRSSFCYNSFSVSVRMPFWIVFSICPNFSKTHLAVNSICLALKAITIFFFIIRLYVLFLYKKQSRSRVQVPSKKQNRIRGGILIR